jgi:HSP20 family protein
VSQGAGSSVIERMQHMHQLMHQLMARAAPGPTGAWQPPTDVYETAEALIVQVELAGVHEDDIDVTLFADYLSVTGTRHHQAPAPPLRSEAPDSTVADAARATSAASTPVAYHVAGILYGPFNLALAIPVNVQRDNVEASFENGLLTIILPKASTPATPTAINIQPRTSDGQEE